MFELLLVAVVDLYHVSNRVRFPANVDRDEIEQSNHKDSIFEIVSLIDSIEDGKRELNFA